MPSFAETFLPLALILPVAGPGMVHGERDPIADGPAVSAHAAQQTASHSGEPVTPEPVDANAISVSDNSLSALLDGFVMRQVRVRQRTYIRITPRGVSSRRDMVAQLPTPQQTIRYREDGPRRCIPVDQIAGVETGSGNRLLLFLEDAKVMSLNLEKACRARDFYSGFYVERNKDGKLCVERDTLQSRNGARCDIDRMMQLVSADD